MPSSQRATPSPQVPSLSENDGMSEVATVGDVDDLGSVASIASFVDVSISDRFSTLEFIISC